MAGQGKKPEDTFDVSLLEGLRERVGQDVGADDEILPMGSAKRSLLFGALIGLAAAAGAAWYIMGASTPRQPAAPQEVPVIRADKSQVKVRPADPGGMPVPNQDKLVYNRIDQGAVKPEVEHLMPAPVAPRELPKAEAKPAAPADALGDGMVPLPKAAAPAAKAEPPAPAAAPLVPVEKVGKAAKAESVAPKAAVSAAKPAPAAAAKAAPAANGAWEVQIAAVREERLAASEWSRAAKAVPDLSAMNHRVVRADLGSKGVYWRLRVGSFADRGEAEALCTRLKAKGVGCVPARR